MAISKERKEALVEQYRELASGSRGLIFTSYSGLSVPQVEDLRGKIRELGGDFHIVKNRLLKLAFDEIGLPMPAEAMIGTTALGFAREDIPAVAKAMVDLAKESEGMTLKGAVVEGSLYTAAQVERLADLPPLPVVQAQLIGVLQAPAARLVGALAGSVRQVVNVIHAYAESEAAG